MKLHNKHKRSSRMRQPQNILDTVIPIFGSTITFGGILDLIESGLAMIVATLTIVFLIIRIRQFLKDNRDA